MYQSLKWLGVFTILLLLSSCGTTEEDPVNPPDNSGGGSSGNAQWTYMVYVAGDNNLAASAIQDINEMEMVGSSSGINVIVQAEFSKDYTPQMPTATLRGKIVKDSDTQNISSSLSNIGSRDMGSKAALTEFIKWAKENYPAEHYALVLWDHGSGWKSAHNSPSRGALQDASSGTFMSLPDLASAVRESGVILDVLDFDACLMAMYEVAYEFKGLSKYMSFSEALEPGDGNPFDTILQALVNNPQMSPKTLSMLTAQKFKSSYQNDSRSSVTKSSVDLAYVEQLHTQLTELSKLLVQNITAERSYLQTARSSATGYKFDGNIDLGDFLSHLNTNTNNSEIKSKITEIKSTLSTMVLANEVYSPDAGSSMLRSTGLAIFVPQRSEISDADLNDYAQLAINSAVPTSRLPWKDVINVLVNGDSSSGQTALETTTGSFSIWLEWDTDADLDLIVWEPNGEFAAPYIGMTSTNGFLSEDSASSGLPFEYYTAAETIQKGDYDIFVNYYDNGSYGYANAKLLFLDPANGINEWITLGSRYMDLQTPAPAAWYDDNQTSTEVWNDVYSDWWWWYSPTYLQRSSSRSYSVVLPVKEHTVEFRIHLKKLPPKNHEKRNTLTNSDTALHDAIVGAREEMDKAQ